MTTGVETLDGQRGDRRRLILAALIPLLACGLQWFFWKAMQPLVWFLFYPAVFFSSWVGGLRGGLVATILSAGLGWYFFIPEEYSFAVQRPIAFLSIAIFMGMGVLFSLFHDRLRMASYTFSPFRDKDGTIVGSVVTGRDITERKQAEQALRQTQSLLNRQANG